MVIAGNILTVKYASKKRGMNSDNMNYVSIVLSQIMVCIIGISIWGSSGWKSVIPYLFIRGTICGFFSSFGKITNTKANVSGYAGVAGSVASLNGPWLVIVECIK